ncbi:MAG: cupin domain-containing protein [Acidimicrobiales bacterium]
MAHVHLAQRSEHQQLEWIGDSTVSVVLDAAASDGQLMILESRLRRGDASPVHVHGEEDEIFLMLQGSGTFWVGEERHELADGGVAFLPRHLPHAYVITSEEAHVLTLATPGGLEGFFRSAGHDRSVPKPEGWAITPATLGAALAAHGGQVVGPPKGVDD